MMKTNWKNIGWFVGLTYALSWTLNLAIWLVALLHAINNHTYQALTTLVHSPNDAVFAFGGAGLYSIVILAVIVALLLRDPLWREDAEQLEVSDNLTELPTVMG
jgi:hypothetical protein